MADTVYVHLWDSLTHGISTAVFINGKYYKTLLVDPRKAREHHVTLIKGKKRTKFLREHGYRLDPHTRGLRRI